MDDRWIGVISDTHGLLRPEAITALEGCARIVHAGDVGDPVILERLGEIAPVVAVRGNVDTAAWAEALPETAVIEESGHFLYLIHNIRDLDLDLAAAGMEGVIFGHSHQPFIGEVDGRFHLNPGSAGPRRFDLPITLAALRFGADGWSAELVDLTAF